MKLNIEKKLQTQFTPWRLDVIDESDNHKGHGGWREGGKSHFRVKIGSDAFKGLSRVAVHRQIYACLESELKHEIHALAIEIVEKTPQKL